MKVAVVGATGMVGEVMMRVLQERAIAISELIPVASEASRGKEVNYAGSKLIVRSLQESIGLKPDVAIFSAGSEASLTWAPKFAEIGCRVIDNSSAWRMDPEVKLVIPEINGDSLSKDDYIIANPNCSTIQLLMALKPIHDRFGLKRVIVSTYQSITGTGVKALRQMENERSGQKAEMAYPYPIDKNCLPHCDVFLENDYTKEEMKLVNESRKILNLPDLKLSATAVRVPVVGGHSESVNVELERPFEISQIKECLARFQGVQLQDNPSMNLYPMPRFAEAKDEVFVGRIRRDNSLDQAVNMWIVSDNLRKGAATNAVQILEKLTEKGYL
jgi:aspartate-semialdehyde dehydrogenase